MSGCGGDAVSFARSFKGTRDRRNLEAGRFQSAFAGRVSYVDISQKLIAIDNRSDGKKYDINMEAIAPSVLRQVHEGGEVSVSAVFDGEHYSARSIDFASANR